jgi:ribosomal protein S18 acetylase RimI-like enzyme
MKYDFRLQTNLHAELEKVTALLRRVWPKNRRFNIRFIEWLYRDNPNGEAIGYNAFSEDDVAAHYVVVPFEVEIEGEPRKSALALNAGVDERHRGQSLFRKLAEMAHQRAQQIGVDHIVAIANANSTPGFLRYLGFQLVTPLDVRMCLTLPRPSGAHSEWQWRRKWRSDDLSWRLHNPGGNYWLSAADDFSCILGRTKYPGVRAVLKVESDPLLRQQIGEQLPQGVTWPPVLWFGKNPELKFAGAIDVPKSLRPSPFNLVFYDLTAQKRRLDPRRVHFEAADFDVM